MSHNGTKVSSVLKCTQNLVIEIFLFWDSMKTRWDYNTWLQHNYVILCSAHSFMKKKSSFEDQIFLWQVLQLLFDRVTILRSAVLMQIDWIWLYLPILCTAEHSEYIRRRFYRVNKMVEKMQSSCKVNWLVRV